ncbi:MAG: GNAT family N-acetyltransferase [Actinomycetota bacterium]|nr:GNAT family N-acetyltransferase [Actinomycetota bacterium]
MTGGQTGELRGERVVLRPLHDDDLPQLVAIAGEPSVSRWWPRLTEQNLREDDSVGFAIMFEGELAGLAQYYEEPDPDYRHAGIDLFLGPRWQGRGLGTDTVRTLARHLVRERGHHRLVIDPAAENEPAIRCYEGVGFKRVGVMRRYERGPEGKWRDGLLLDLLAEELD